MTYSRLAMLFWMPLLVAPTLSVAKSLDVPIVGRNTQQSIEPGGSEFRSRTPAKRPSREAVPAYQVPPDDEDC